MSYKTDATWQALLLIVGLFMALGAMSITIYDIGKEFRSLEILTQCKNGEIVTINDTEIHCGIVSKELNIEAAQYRGVKNCVKLVKEWEDE